MSDSSAAIEPLERQTTPSIIADRVRRSILSGAFKPGHRIAELKLCQQLGVSRGPIREALQRLVQEGLLTNTLNKGVCVVDLGVDDIEDIFAARIVVEKAAAEHLFKTKNPQVIAALRAIVGRMSDAAARSDREALIDCDLEFHSVLVGSMQSMRIDRMFSTLAAETFLCLSNLVPKYYSLEALVEEHNEVISHIESGELEDLLTLLVGHFEAGLEAVKR